MAPNPLSDSPTLGLGLSINARIEDRQDIEMAQYPRGVLSPITISSPPAYTSKVPSPIPSPLPSPSPISPVKEGRGSFNSDSTLVLRSQNESPTERKESAEGNANWLSKLVFHWISDVLRKGFRRPLQATEIPLIHPKRRARNLADTVQEVFKEKHKGGDKFALFWALYRVFRTDFLIGGICRGIADVLLVIIPYTLRYLIQFAIDSYVAGLTHKNGPPLWHGIAYLAGIVVMLAIQTFCHNHYMFLLGVIGGQARAVLTSAIFDKSMRVMGRNKVTEIEEHEWDDEEESTSKHSAEKKTRNKKKSKAQKKKKEKKEEWSTGHLTGLLSVDCARIAQTASGLHILWTAPLSLCIAIALLIVNLRVSALVGLGLLVVGFIILIVIVGVLFRKRKAIDKIAEGRVSLSQEVLDAIRVVKYFGWEEGFARHIRNLRGQETHMLQHYTAIKNAVGAVSQGLPVMTAMISFITYALTHSGLSPAIVFSSTALFTSLRMPLIYLPICIQGCIDSAASLLRIQEFLLTEEMDEYAVKPEMEAAAEIRHATFTWDQPEAMEEEHSSETVALPTDKVTRSGFRLDNVDLRIYRGELLAVIGSVGSGKTSLLSALSGDMAKISGKVVWGASHALCTQQAWMMNATVRDNIIFGSSRGFDPRWYRTVTEACSLARDLDLLPHGDQTVVGERGVVLSGGQKQRISLARAMYSEKDVVLLDDPLSAVDANVGRAIVEDALCGQMSGKTRVLCTHDMTLLPRCDRILWMDQGRIRTLDTYKNLILHDPDFVKLVKQPEGEDSSEKRKSKIIEKKQTQEAERAQESKKEKEVEDTLIQEEDRETKSVSWAVYGSLFTTSGSIFLAILCLPMLVLGSGSMVMTQLWLAWWSSDRFHMERNIYIAIYVGLAAGQVFFLYMFGLFLGSCCTRSSQVMLNKAVLRLLRAPISFFDTTPLGRHMNRFSTDVEAMDYHLPEAMRMFSISLCGLAAIFSLIIAYFHWFAIAVGTLLVVLVFLAIYYRATAREVKRHESILRSVVFSRFVEGLSGVSTLRTYGMHSNFSHKLCEAVDDMNSASFTTVAVQRWLSLRQDAATILLVITMGVLVIVQRQTQNPSISGLVLSLMLSAVQVIQVVVREWADVEAAMNSTERLHAYATTLPQEIDDTTAPPAHWPQSGEVDFSRTRMRYREGLPEALKGVNLRIKGGEHVAIVGRTGAGKSSIVNALFRLTDLSGGSVAIDGKSIAQVPLGDLRSGALSIIPQETALFSGTVRSNLDPFEDYSDEVIWDALKTAGLDHALHPSDMIHDQGANLSLGQKQLLALARVLTRNSRIVVCDEATAALDTETDDHIQRTMRRAFRNKTVICIAHRLRTVLWYDRICVMDAGQVAELGSPLELFRIEGGIFNQMCTKLSITEQQIMAATSLARSENKAPLIDLALPSPNIEVDFGNLTFNSLDERVEDEPQDYFGAWEGRRGRRMSRMRSMRSPSPEYVRRGRLYRSPVSSWVLWEAAVGRESIVRNLDY